MGLLANRILLITLVAATLLAGCANNGTDGNGDGGDASPPAQMTNEEARTLLSGAIEDMPEKIGFKMDFVQGAQTILTFEGMFDNTTERSYFKISGDPGAIANLSGNEQDEESEQMAAFLANGMEVYGTPQGSVILANGTAFAFPADENDTEETPNPLGAATGSFDAFTDSEEMLAPFADENVTIQSVTPTVYRGKPAVEIVAVTHEDDANTTAKIVVFTNPRRVAHIESDIPVDPEDNTPFTGGTVKGDFFYDNEVKATPSPAVVRALGLAYKSDSNPFTGGSSDEVSWTFMGSEGIATSEIEIHVKSGEGDAMSGDLQALPNAWTMKLSEGTKTQGGITVTFTDADGNGKVSKGDTLKATSEDGSAPTVLLYDTETDTYVVPGAGVLVALGVLALAALALRRKA